MTYYLSERILLYQFFFFFMYSRQGCPALALPKNSFIHYLHIHGLLYALYSYHLQIQAQQLSEDSAFGKPSIYLTIFILWGEYYVINPLFLTNPHASTTSSNSLSSKRLQTPIIFFPILREVLLLVLTAVILMLILMLREISNSRTQRVGTMIFLFQICHPKNKTD